MSEFDAHETLLPPLSYDDFVLMAQNVNPEYSTLRDEVRQLLNQRRQELWEMVLEHEEDIMKSAFPERYIEKITYEGKHVYTQDDFPGCENLQIGDFVTHDVIQDLADLLLPAYYSRSIFQMGEPYDHIALDNGNGMVRYYPIYSTFRFVVSADETEIWAYCGHCLEGWGNEWHKKTK